MIRLNSEIVDCPIIVITFDWDDGFAMWGFDTMKDLKNSDEVKSGELITVVNGKLHIEVYEGD